MLCEICRKQMAAVARMIDRGYGEQKVAVCFSCAKNIDDERSVSKYTEFFWGENAKKGTETRIERCPKCGYSLDDIMKASYVGCSDCYKVFYDDIKTKINQIHGKNVHVGKRPLSSMKKQDKIASTSASLLMARAIEGTDIDLASIARKHFPGKREDF